MKIIIIGSGAAGYYSAKAAREKNKECDIEIISKETHMPYFKPMLTSYLSKEMAIDKLYISPQEWYEKNNIKLNLGKNIKKINTSEKNIVLEDNAVINYDKLIIASGAHAFMPPIPGKEKLRALTLRTLENANKIKNYLKSAENIVIVGGGLLGLQAAYEISKLNIKVILVERNPILMHRQLDKTSSKILKSLMENNNVKVLIGESVKEVLGFTKVTGVKLYNNKSLRCDLVLFSIGIKPNVNLIENSEIKYHKGILVNTKMETNIKDVYACGDCAELSTVSYGNWVTAQKTGEIAGSNAAGGNSVFKNFVPSFFFQGFNTKIFSCGNLNNIESTQQVRFIDKDRNIFKRLYFKHDEVTGAILMGNTDKSNNIMNAIINKKTFNDIMKEYTLI